MKLLLPVIAVVFGSLCCLCLDAKGDEQADRAALRLILTNYIDGVNSGDLSKLSPYLATNVTGVMVTGQPVQGFDELRSYWKKIQELIGPGGSYHVSVKVDKTEFYGDVAVSRGSTEDVVRLGNGKELPFNSFWTSVCCKEDGAWKVVRMQAAMNPIDNVFISMRSKRAEIFCGICGVVAGIILTLMFKFIRGRGPALPRT
jgi:ketosteroid isomerase-like protein